METILAEAIDIRDRSRLVTLRERGRVEIAALRSRNRAFAEVCNAFYQSRRVVQPLKPQRVVLDLTNHCTGLRQCTMVAQAALGAGAGAGGGRDWRCSAVAAPVDPAAALAM